MILSINVFVSNSLWILFFLTKRRPFYLFVSIHPLFNGIEQTKKKIFFTLREPQIFHWMIKKVIRILFLRERNT